jgi:hypothetical protein
VVVRRIAFDTSMVVDYIIPDSPSDFGAILLWVLMTLLVILVIVDVRMYLEYRKMSQKREQQQQNLTIREHMKTSEEERSQAYVDIRNKVDKIIEINKL